MRTSASTQTRSSIGSGPAPCRATAPGHRPGSMPSSAGPTPAKPLETGRCKLMDAPESQPGSESESLPESLAGRIYLLAYDLDRRQLFDRTRTAFLTRAAVLIELAWRGQLDADGHPAATGPGITGADITGDLVLDRVLAQIRPH